jgi:hypothetical protein
MDLDNFSLEPITSSCQNMIHLSRFCLATSSRLCHTDSPETFLPHHTPASPSTPGPMEECRLQDPLLPPCLSATSILTQPQNVSSSVWNNWGGSGVPLGLVQETAAEGRLVKVLTQHREGAGFHSNALPARLVQPPSCGPVQCLHLREGRGRDRKVRGKEGETVPETKPAVQPA